MARNLQTLGGAAVKRQLSRESPQSVKSSSLPKVTQSRFHYFVLYWILICKASEGESRPMLFISSLGIKGKSEAFPFFSSGKWELNGEKNRRILMNNSTGFPPISDGQERFDLESKLNVEQAGSNNPTDTTLQLGRRKKRGFFDKGQEKQRLEEEYDRSFRLFWFLGGVAIVVFILMFILTLLCFCCPNLAKDKTRKQSTSNVPQISVPVAGSLMGVDPVTISYQQPSPAHHVAVEMRPRSPSVFSSTGGYVSTHRLSQEQVNTIQLLSQSRRNSALPSSSQGLMPTNPLIDVNVIQEYRPDVS